LAAPALAFFLALILCPISCGLTTLTFGLLGCRLLRLSDIRVLFNNDALLQRGLPQYFHQYNTEQFQAVQVPGQDHEARTLRIMGKLNGQGLRRGPNEFRFGVQ
jgi:hypothetical protein